MEKGKMYVHRYENPENYIVVMCTCGNFVRRKRSRHTFSGTVIKVYGTNLTAVGDHNDYWACSMFQEHNEQETIMPSGQVIHVPSNTDETPCENPENCPNANTNYCDKCPENKNIKD